MAIRILLILTLATLFFLFRADSATFTIKNNCPYTIWPATLIGGGGAQLSTTGFELVSKASTSINVLGPSSGRFWARSSCYWDSNNKFICGSGDCASGQIACNGAGGIPPASLVEFFIAAEGGRDFYDISLVDGFNLPVSVTPREGSSNCTAASCAVDVNADCPHELALKSTIGNNIIACKSACVAFNQPQYCCTGIFGSPQSCSPSNYSMFFKGKCPQAYSYAYDDKTSTFTCTGGANYLIAFCP